MFLRQQLKAEARDVGATVQYVRAALVVTVQRSGTLARSNQRHGSGTVPALHARSAANELSVGPACGADTTCICVHDRNAGREDMVLMLQHRCKAREHIRTSNSSTRHSPDEHEHVCELLLT